MVMLEDARERPIHEEQGKESCGPGNGLKSYSSLFILISIFPSTTFVHRAW
jgi:hypothetical protein